MIDICPTVTATNPHTYREQIERITPFAKRIHIDFADGELAPTKLVPVEQAWIPVDVVVDLHVMVQNPATIIEQLIALKPKLIILHSESDGNILGLLREIKGAGVHAGLALLPNSQPEAFANEIEVADHVLIFGGHLGYQGGDADMSQLDKIPRIKEINFEVELAWDGGANIDNAKDLTDAGITVLNVGGYIHKDDFPDKAYAILDAKVNGG